MSINPILTEHLIQFRQVLLQFRPLFEFADSEKLKSKKNYLHWKVILEARLSIPNTYLPTYFASGKIPMFDDNLSAADLETLTFEYDSALHQILMASVSSQLQLYGVGLGGYEFAQELVREFDTYTLAEVSSAFEKLFSLPKNLDKGYRILLDFKVRYSKVIGINDQLMGLWLLHTYGNPRSRELVFRKGLEMLSLRSVYELLRHFQ